MTKKIFAYGICLYKIENKNIKILLCKSISSFEKWGMLKGVQTKSESKIECALREFEEECSIKLVKKSLEEYFEQQNETKDIGIWLVNASSVRDLNRYIIDDKLLENYLSWENSKVKFFSINELPKIKTKQKFILKEIISYLQNTHQHH